MLLISLLTLVGQGSHCGLTPPRQLRDCEAWVDELQGLLNLDPLLLRQAIGFGMHTLYLYLLLLHNFLLLSFLIDDLLNFGFSEIGGFIWVSNNSQIALA